MNKANEEENNSWTKSIKDSEGKKMLADCVQCALKILKHL